MTKQEEIREGIAQRIFLNNHPDKTVNRDWGLLSESQQRFYYHSADELSKYLHSQGVVISVDTGRDLSGCCIARLEPLIIE